jgi:hypothetical protein
MMFHLAYPGNVSPWLSAANNLCRMADYANSLADERAKVAELEKENAHTAAIVADERSRNAELIMQNEQLRIVIKDLEARIARLLSALKEAREYMQDRRDDFDEHQYTPNKAERIKELFDKEDAAIDAIIANEGQEA